MKIKDALKKLEKRWKNIIFNIIFIVLSISIVILFFKNNLLTSSLLAVIAIIGLIKWRSKLTLVVFLFFGILFGVGEIIVANYSVWNYSINDLMGIPFWLFILWGNTATFIYQTIYEIKKLGVKDDKLIH